MIKRCGKHLFGHMRARPVSTLIASASGTMPQSLILQAQPLYGGAHRSHVPSFLSIRKFAITTHLSEAQFHLVADRTIQRFIDLFDK